MPSRSRPPASASLGRTSEVDTKQPSKVDFEHARDFEATNNVDASWKWTLPMMHVLNAFAKFHPFEPFVNTVKGFVPYLGYNEDSLSVVG